MLSNLKSEIVFCNRNILVFLKSWGNLFSGKRLKERERERDLKRTAADRNSITIFYIDVIK